MTFPFSRHSRALVMAEPTDNLASPTAPRAPARSVEADHPLWVDREIDIAALRRWFVRRIAAEALEQLKRERQDDG